MSGNFTDPTDSLYLALRPALKDDPAVLAAVMGSLVRVYDIPPVNVAAKDGDYLVLGQADVVPLPANRLRLALPELTVHVWSLMTPPGLARLRAIVPAVLDVMLALAPLETESHHIRTAQWVRSQYLTDLDGKTAHGVVTVEYATEAK